MSGQMYLCHGAHIRSNHEFVDLLYLSLEGELKYGIYNILFSISFISFEEIALLFSQISAFWENNNNPITRY